jgi:hypothetical protein
MLPLVSGQSLFLFSAQIHPIPRTVIRRCSMTRYLIRQRECCRIIEENHSE